MEDFRSFGRSVNAMRYGNLHASARSARTTVSVYWLCLLLLAAVVYGTHIAHGGFAWDDWRNAATTFFPNQERFLGPFDAREAVYEPGVAFALPLPYLAFGLNPAWHLALAALLAVAMSACLFSLLRELELEFVVAGTVAALALVFPWSDSVRLWATAGINQLAACFYFLGATLALRGLRAPRPLDRRLRRASLAFYLASMLTYPIVIPAVALSGLLYRLRLSWKQAWCRGRREAIAALIVGGYVALSTTKRLQSPGAGLRHAASIARQSVILVAHGLSPIASIGPFAILSAASGLALLATGVALARARHGDQGGAAALRRWLAMTVFGFAAALIAYAPLIPASPRYAPLAAGLYNRVGLLAGPAVGTALVGLLGATVELTIGRRTSREIKLLATAVLAACIFVGWAQRVRADASNWDRAAEQSRALLATLDRQLPRLPHGSTIITVGDPHYEAAGIPIFASLFDLANAVRVTRRDRTLNAYPLFGMLLCSADAASSGTRRYRTLERTRYGRLYIVDIPKAQVASISSAHDCRRARARFDLD